MPNRIVHAEEPDELPLAQALADARARPWLYRLTDVARVSYQDVYEQLRSEGSNGPFVQRFARALALDEEACRAAAARDTA